MSKREEGLKDRYRVERMEEKAVIRYGLERLVRDTNLDLDVRNKAEVMKDFQCNPKR